MANTPFTQGLRPLCLPCATTELSRSRLKAEGRQNGCLGRSRVVGTQDVQASPWTPWSPWSFEHVQNSHTKVAEEVGRSQVAQRRQDEGTHIAVVAEWMHSGRPLVAQLKMRTLCINLSDTSAFLVPPLCLLWTTNGVHWAITVATTVPPFSDHGNTWVTMAMVLPSLCLLCATCCATTTALVVQGRHKGRAAAVTQKQNFLGSGDHWAS